MALDKILIGDRIRKIRADTFDESRKDFAKRCDLTERHIAQIERGEFLVSLPTPRQNSNSYWYRYRLYIVWKRKK